MNFQIKRALLSVTNKSGLIEFATGLSQLGVSLLSTGGTAQVLREAGLNVTDVAQVTGFPEMLDGRIKTLHPRIHGGILARRDLPEHVRQMAEHGIEGIDLVCVNLYIFNETINKPGCTLEEAIENIDIGGPCLIRAAAKNHIHVAVVTDPADYTALLHIMRHNNGALPLATRQQMAAKAFRLTHLYGNRIRSGIYIKACGTFGY